MQRQYLLCGCNPFSSLNAAAFFVRINAGAGPLGTAFTFQIDTQKHILKKAKKVLTNLRIWAIISLVLRDRGMV